jgi:hypothetical protein
MSGWEMKVGGLDEVRAALKDIGVNQSVRILNKALAAGAEVYRDDERNRCPERPDLPSGSALPVGALKADVDISRKKNARSLWTVGPGFFGRQAHLVEFGHRLVRGGKNRLMEYGIQIGPGKVVGWVQPHPYIRAAFEGSTQEALDVIKQVVADEIAKLRYKAARKGGR